MFEKLNTLDYIANTTQMWAMYNYWRKKTQAVIRKLTPHVQRAHPRKIKKQITFCMTPTNFLVKPVTSKKAKNPEQNPIAENENMERDNSQANNAKRQKQQPKTEIPNTMSFQRTENAPQKIQKAMLVQGALLHAGKPALFFFCSLFCGRFGCSVRWDS